MMQGLLAPGKCPKGKLHSTYQMTVFVKHLDTHCLLIISRLTASM